MRFTVLIFVFVALFAVFANGLEKDCGACIDQYEPVCAQHNGIRRTFSNGCNIGIANCVENANFVKIGNGQC